jgi:hypothetical protein
MATPLPRFLPVDLPLEVLCAAGLGCPGSMNPACCAKNHHYTMPVPNNMYKAGTELVNMNVCRTDLVWLLHKDDGSERCRSLTCKFPHIAKHEELIKARVAELKEKSDQLMTAA